MIPVRQTRFSTETFGNCFEACIASILELPLSAVPDRVSFIDADAWADLVQRTRRAGGDKAVGSLLEPEGTDVWRETLNVWLYERGLGLLKLELDDRRNREMILPMLRGYWIGIFQISRDQAHACVLEDARVVHNPMPNSVWPKVDELVNGTILTAADPPMICRRLGRELLPDVAGAVNGFANSTNDLRERRLA